MVQICSECRTIYLTVNKHEIAQNKQRPCLVSAWISYSTTNKLFHLFLSLATSLIKSRPSKQFKLNPLKFESYLMVSISIKFILLIQFHFHEYFPPKLVRYFVMKYWKHVDSSQRPWKVVVAFKSLNQIRDQHIISNNFQYWYLVP